MRDAHIVHIPPITLNLYFLRTAMCLTLRYRLWGELRPAGIPHLDPPPPTLLSSMGRMR